jgi:hypothetical protein
MAIREGLVVDYVPTTEEAPFLGSATVDATIERIITGTTVELKAEAIQGGTVIITSAAAGTDPGEYAEKP